MESLEELGKKAYQKQIWGDYLEAVNIYNKAIRKFPKDPRLLNNRCLCYIELKDFKKAMEDADVMIRLFPKNVKSYYRKGEVLTATKRYIEAEESFRKVLTMDPCCEDARQQVLEVQVMQLCQLGYNKEQAINALTLTRNVSTQSANVEDAEKILKYGALEIYGENADGDVYYSDDESSSPSNNIIKQDNSVYDPLTDPSNPLKSCSLWVGFVTEAVTEKNLKEMFSKYGKVLSVYVFYPTHCAFINFSDPTSPGKAMKALQGKLVGGKNILIKFPNSAAAQGLKLTKAI